MKIYFVLSFPCLFPILRRYNWMGFKFNKWISLAIDQYFALKVFSSDLIIQYIHKMENYIYSKFNVKHDLFIFILFLTNCINWPRKHKIKPTSPQHAPIYRTHRNGNGEKLHFDSNSRHRRRILCRFILVIVIPLSISFSQLFLGFCLSAWLQIRSPKIYS